MDTRKVFCTILVTIPLAEPPRLFKNISNAISIHQSNIFLASKITLKLLFMFHYHRTITRVTYSHLTCANKTLLVVFNHYIELISYLTCIDIVYFKISKYE